MKKILLSMVALLATVAASAQVYVGGEVGFWRNTDDNHTTFTIAPQVGYNLSDKWAIGTEIGYNHDYSKGWSTNGFEIAPYARYTVAKAGPVSFILDGGFGFSTYKAKYNKDTKLGDVDYESDSFNAWEVGITPGVKVSLAKNVDFIASLGFLGYRDNDDADKDNAVVSSHSFGEHGFGFHFNSNDLKFGVIYNF